MHAIRFFDYDQKTVYLRALPEQFRMAMEILLTSGIRLHELEWVRVRDLRLEIGVHRILVEDANVRYRVRTVYLPSYLAEKIRAFVDERGLEPEDRVFVHSPGWNRIRLERAHRKAATMAGSPEYTIDDHRHTAAVNLASVGAPMTMIRAQLGLGSVKDAMVYAPFHPEHPDGDTLTARLPGPAGTRGRPSSGP